MDEMLSLIAFHGITDLYKRNLYIIPMYSLVTTTSIFIPMNLLNAITIVNSSYHFSHDGYLNKKQMLICLFYLLYYGEYRWSQNIMLGYMGFIHTPIHFSHLYLSDNEIAFTLCTLICIYYWDGLLKLLKQIIYSGGRQPNTLYHKLLLGIINSHILCNI